MLIRYNPGDIVQANRPHIFPGYLYLLISPDERVCIRGERQLGEHFNWHERLGDTDTHPYSLFKGELTEEENVLYALAMMGLLERSN